jgi:NADPH:quinone reductase-like Zn-dependent oxidoreductase
MSLEDSPIRLYCNNSDSNQGSSAGEWYLFKREKEEARLSFTKAKTECPTDVLENAAAASELERLNLGADRVIDYAKEDFTNGSYRYDIIFDSVAKRSFGECKKVLTPKGVYVSTLPSFSVILNQYLTGFLTQKKARLVMAAPNVSDMEWMKAQIEAGRIKVVIDKVFPLDQAKDALAYSESGRARGKIVIKAA